MVYQSSYKRARRCDKSNKKSKKKNINNKKEKNNTMPDEWHKRPNNLNPKYKSKLCKTWANSGTCRYGNKCVFAHSEGELQKCLPINIGSCRKNQYSTNCSDSSKLENTLVEDLDKLVITQNTKSIVDNNDIFTEITTAIHKSINPIYMRKVSRYSFAR